MSPNSFDKEIKAKLFAAETDVSDHLWSAVALNLAPQRKRRWWLWFLLPCAVGLGSGAVILLQPGEVNSKNVTALIDDDGPMSESAAMTGNERSGLASEKSENIQYATISDASLDINEERSGANQIVSKDSKKKVPLGISTKKMPSMPAMQEHIIAFEKEDQIPVEFLTSHDAERTISVPVTKTALALLEPLRTTAIPFFESPDPNLKICPSFAAPSHFRPFFELGFGAGLPFRTLEERSQEMMGYKQNREQTEKVRSSLAIQGLVGVEINDQFEIKGGLGLLKILEVFDYVDETASRTITNITITTDTLPSGNTVIRTDTSVTTEYGQRIKLSQNRYTFLEVPVLAGYRFKVRDHRFFVQGGAIFNIALKTRGDIRSPEDNIQSIDTDNNETPAIFRKTSGIELTGSIGYELEMSERSSLRFSATYRHALNDLTLADYPLGQRYRHIHLGVSLKHNLK